MKKIIIFVLACYLIPAATYAANIDCLRATSMVEKFICNDKGLAKLDFEMAEAYRVLRSHLDTRQVRALVDAQQLWIVRRGICKDRTCLKTAYEDRIVELSFQLHGGAISMVPVRANDDTDESDPTRAMRLKCDYSDYRTFEYESVEIQVAPDNAGDIPTVKEFGRQGKFESQQYLVLPGTVAECVYPSGTRVRVKIGEGETRPYGECGADPEVFATVWVNGRKIASRLQFAGHCMEYREGYQQLSFKILGSAKPVVQKCGTRKPAQGDAPLKDVAQRMQEPITVCVDYPDVSSYPVDSLEYPPPSVSPLPMGAIELLTGRDEVCKAVQQELEADFYTFSNYPQKVTLARPVWEDSSLELPPALQGSRVSVFDFDNDGRQDRVFSRLFESNYMDGSVLLIQFGSSARALSIDDNLMGQASLYLPCQMDKKSRAIEDCPSFSQNADEAGYEIPGPPGEESVFFRGRYTSISPFTFQHATYLGLSSRSEGTTNYVAVVKPLPARKFQPMCLFRRVIENF